MISLEGIDCEVKVWIPIQIFSRHKVFCSDSGDSPNSVFAA